MFSNDNELKKYFYLISYAGIILAIILNLSSVFSFIQYLWQLIIPFIVGFCIAFILNIITNQLEKSLLKNVIILAILAGILTIFSTQNIVTEKFLTLNDEIELTGAGFVESTIKLWGYIIFAFVIIGAIISSVIFFQKNKNKKIMFTLLSIPGYLVVMFIVMVGTDFIFVKPNEFDKERKYIEENINSTREAYGINASEININFTIAPYGINGSLINYRYSWSISEAEINVNKVLVDNIPIVSQNMVKQSLEDTQTEAGYYTFRNILTTKFIKDNQEKLAYIAPREIAEQSISYNNKTYELTHGIGQIIVDANKTSEA